MKTTQVFVYLAISCAGLLDLHKKALKLLIIDGYYCRYAAFNAPEKLIKALKAANPKPDLLIASYKHQSSAIDGVQLLQRCKQIHAELKVVLTSLHFSTRNLLAIKKAPMQPDAILKLLYGEPEPFVTLEEVLHTIKRRQVSEGFQKRRPAVRLGRTIPRLE